MAQSVTSYRAGDIVDRRYAIKREIAHGGVGTIFEAEHAQMGRSVAFKCLRPEHAARDESCARLEREAAILGRLRHENIVLGLDAGTDNGAPFVVLELLEGRSLEGVLSVRQRLPIEHVVHIGRHLASALAAAHARGVVHRDVKPGNVFLSLDADRRETAKLLDFGIAAFTGTVDTASVPKLTKQDALIGTPEYMAPERLLSKDAASPRADVYAAGVTLYECLTGTVPFSGNYGEVLLKASTTDAPPVSARGVSLPAAVERVLLRSMARAAEDRFADGAELFAAWVEATATRDGGSNVLGAQALAQGATAEQRRYRRAPYVTPVRIVEGSGSVLDGHSEDVSEGGLLVLTPRACTTGDLVRVRFSLPASGKIVEVAALACWVRTARGSGAAGLQFQQLPDGARDEIARYVTLMAGD